MADSGTWTNGHLSPLILPPPPPLLLALFLPLAPDPVGQPGRASNAELAAPSERFEIGHPHVERRVPALSILTLSTLTLSRC